MRAGDWLSINEPIMEQLASMGLHRMFESVIQTVSAKEKFSPFIIRQSISMPIS
jgi:hypothetical protein